MKGLAVPIRTFFIDFNRETGLWDVILELKGCKPVQSSIRDCRPETIKAVYELCYKTAVDHLGKTLHEVPTIIQHSH